jgi:hypothetical protein
MFIIWSLIILYVSCCSSWTDIHSLTKSAGTRPRHPERASICDLLILFQLPLLNLLRQHFPLGCSRRSPHTPPKIHILPGYVCRALQPLLSIVVLPHLRQSGPPTLQHLDSPCRDCLHGLLLVSIRVLPRLVGHTNLASPCRVRSGLPYRDHASPRTDHALSLGHVDDRPRSFGIVRTEAVAYYNGCRLPGLVGLHPWRSTVPSRSPPVPQNASAQSPKRSETCEGVLQGDRHSVHDFRVCGWQ